MFGKFPTVLHVVNRTVDTRQLETDAFNVRANLNTHQLQEVQRVVDLGGTNTIHEFVIKLFEKQATSRTRLGPVVWIFKQVLWCISDLLEKRAMKLAVVIACLRNRYCWRSELTLHQP